MNVAASPRSFARLKVMPMTPSIGAEIGGIDLSAEQDDETIAEIREKLRAQEDVVRRVDIVAPQTGVVQNLKVFTVGGVVRPGEPIMEIAPIKDNLVIRAQIGVQYAG